MWLEDVNIGELHIDLRDRGELVNLAEIKRPASERTLDVTQELMNDVLAYVSEAHTEAVETNHQLNREMDRVAAVMMPRKAMITPPATARATSLRAQSDSCVIRR